MLRLRDMQAAGRIDYCRQSAELHTSIHTGLLR